MISRMPSLRESACSMVACKYLHGRPSGASQAEPQATQALLGARHLLAWSCRLRLMRTPFPLRRPLFLFADPFTFDFRSVSGMAAESIWHDKDFTKLELDRSSVLILNSGPARQAHNPIKMWQSRLLHAIASVTAAPSFSSSSEAISFLEAAGNHPLRL